jgi:glycosyltransferase involved in cell wall biosynthesis
MISVLVLGQPYWGTRIARSLDGCAPDVSATFVSARRYLGLLARHPRAGRVVVLRAGFRVGATTARGRAFDAYWSVLTRAIPKAARCHYWLGTDVLNTLEEAAAGTLRRGAVASSRDDLHIADAPWLAQELETVGLRAEVASVPQAYRPADVAPTLPERFRVLTYISADRFDFYGGDTILAAARRLPDVQFDVVGRADDPTGSGLPNVAWHGWVSDMPRFYAETTVVLRIPRHDGLGATVIEGLLNARHVIYTYEMPFVQRIEPPTADNLVEAIDALRIAAAAGRLAPNVAGRDYAIATFDEARLVDRLISLLRAAR